MFKMKHFPACSRCDEREQAPGQRYCRKCAATYMREWRKTHPLSAEAMRRAAARTYARTYLKRGKIKWQPCQSCGSMLSQIHHPDYRQPLLVEWLCRPCHLDHHRKEAA